MLYRSFSNGVQASGFSFLSREWEICRKLASIQATTYYFSLSPDSMKTTFVALDSSMCAEYFFYATHGFSQQIKTEHLLSCALSCVRKFLRMLIIHIHFNPFVIYAKQQSAFCVKFFFLLFPLPIRLAALWFWFPCQ